jgi:hypothetical protein
VSSVADPWQAICDVWGIEPEDHATKSRDYGRGFSDAINRVREAIESNGISFSDSDTPGASPSG